MQTNILIVPLQASAERTNPAADLRDQLQDLGIRTAPISATQLRFVTHLGIDRSDIDETLRRITAAEISAGAPAIQAAR